MSKLRILYKGLSVGCSGPHGKVKRPHESRHDQETAHDDGAVCG